MKRNVLVDEIINREWKPKDSKDILRTFEAVWDLASLQEKFCMVDVLLEELRAESFKKNFSKSPSYRLSIPEIDAERSL